MSSHRAEHVIVYQRENMSHTQLIKRQAELVEYLRSAMRPSKGHRFKEPLVASWTVQCWIR